MKICLITSVYPPQSLGGVGINVAKQARALKEAGDHVCVITAADYTGPSSLRAHRSIEDGIVVYRFFPFNVYNHYGSVEHKRKIHPVLKIIWHTLDIYNLHSWWTVLRILREERPEIIHSTYLPGLSPSVFWAARVAGIPVVHTLRGSHFLCPCANFICPYTGFRECRFRPFPCRVYSLFKRIIVGSLPKAVISPSRFILDRHREYGFFPNSELLVVPNFIDNASPKIHQRQANTETEFLFVGRLSPEKGVRLLLDAFVRLRDDRIRLTIVGDGPLREEVKRIASGDSRIRLCGALQREAVAGCYAAADVLVVPSICHDNFPTVILEAFLFGLPVIGSRRGGIPELVSDGSCGLLFDPSQPDQLYQCLKAVVDDFKTGGTRFKQMGTMGQKRVEAYRKDKVIRELRGVYTTVLARSRAPKEEGR